MLSQVASHAAARPSTHCRHARPSGLRVLAVASGSASSSRQGSATVVLEPLAAPPVAPSGLGAPPAADRLAGAGGDAQLAAAAAALEATLQEQRQTAGLQPPAGAPAALPEAGGAWDWAANGSALWALGVLTLGYLHLSVTIYALPSLLPLISGELALSDTQGGWITTGYTIAYGLALVPAGLLSDSVNRPRLMAGGVALWSLATMAAASCGTFGTLMATRVFFAVAQGVQNPVAYSLLPELFPNHRTAAMAVYNSAIYLGRAAAFVVVILAGQAAAQNAGVDVGSAGAAVAEAASSWRPLLWWLGPPGLAIAGLALWTVREPRERPAEPAAGAGASSCAAVAPEPPTSLEFKLGQLGVLLRDRRFLALTAATSFGDVASWALIGWQATFYAREMGLDAAVYAPALATIIPLGGIVGGIGSAVFGDRLTRSGRRAWLTAGTSVAATPLIAASFLADDYRLSFAALLVGYALSECWRSPAAVMVREVSPLGLGSTASAVHLCVRGVTGAMGPIGIAALTGEYGLQLAMLLIPACHLMCGLGLAATEEVLKLGDPGAPAQLSPAARQHAD